MNGVHCVSEEMRQTVSRYGLTLDKSFVIRPAIDTDRFSRGSRGIRGSSREFRLLSVGRLHWKKGYEFALLAVQSLISSGARLTYHIVGTGPEDEKLRYLRAALEIEEHVVYRGALAAEEVQEALQNTDVFLLPSLSEGLSNSALEAMAMEVPTIATNVGGMSEVIDNGGNGVIVPPMDPQAIAESIKLLMSDKSTCIRLAQAGRKRVVQEFSLESQLDQFINWYDTLLSRSSN
jgi:colanic acid/amylovoran biosynthesis glycosyltransferase